MNQLKRIRRALLTASCVHKAMTITIVQNPRYLYLQAVLYCPPGFAEDSNNNLRTSLGSTKHTTRSHKRSIFLISIKTLSFLAVLVSRLAREAWSQVKSNNNKKQSNSLNRLCECERSPVLLLLTNNGMGRIRR